MYISLFTRDPGLAHRGLNGNPGRRLVSSIPYLVRIFVQALPVKRMFLSCYTHPKRNVLQFPDDISVAADPLVRFHLIQVGS